MNSFYIEKGFQIEKEKLQNSFKWLVSNFNCLPSYHLRNRRCCIASDVYFIRTLQHIGEIRIGPH